MNRRGFLMLAGAGVLAACDAREPAPRKTPSPGEQKLALRIISCAPNLTELLFALGVGDQVVGVTPFCQFPEEAKALPKLGDLMNPSLEAMVAARPDLIATVPGNRKVIDFFRARPNVEIFEANACDTLAQIEETALRLGEAVGRPAEARALVEQTRAGLDALRAETAGLRPLRVLVVLGRETGGLTRMTVIGGGGFVSELLETAGATNVMDPALGLYPDVSREALLRLAPDVVLEMHHGEDSPAVREEIRAAWAPLAGLVPAARDGAIAVLADSHVTIPGAGLDRDARALAAALAPFRKQ